MALERVEGKRHESAVDFVVKTFRDKLEKKELHPGDRIVTQGAYQVKLAGASSAIPAHSHEH